MPNDFFSSFNFRGLGAHSLVSAIVFSLAVLGACGNNDRPAVSLEEAKQITADLEGTDYVPPPRTITDVTVLLDEQKNADIETLNEWRAKADAEPPATEDPSVLAEFYSNRGLAASDAGRVRQSITDYEKAITLVRAGGTRYDDLSRYLAGLGKQYYFLGDYHRALSTFTEAYSVLRGEQTGKRHGTALLQTFPLSRLGRFDQARSLIAHAGSLQERMNSWQEGRYWIPVNRAFFEFAKGFLAHAEGQYDEAERLLRSGLTNINDDIGNLWKSEPIGLTGNTISYVRAQVEFGLHRSLSANLLRQERLSAAEAEARTALQAAVKLWGIHHARTATSLYHVSKILIEQSRFDEARQLIAEALAIYRRIGADPNSYPLAQAQRVRADALVAEGKWHDALVIYQDIDRNLVTDPDLDFVTTDLTWALPTIASGQPEKAREKLQLLFERRSSRLGDQHASTAEARGLLAAALAAQDKREEALSHFQAALPVLLSASGGSDTEESSTTLGELRLQFILGSYISLLIQLKDTDVVRHAGIDAVGEAFRIADVARARTLKRALSASSARAAARAPGLSDLARRQQDAQKQIAALYGSLSNALSVPAAEQDATSIRDLNTRIEQLQAAHTTLSGEIDTRYPDYGRLMDPQPPTVAEAQGYLRPGEALVAFYVGEDRTYVWAVPARGPMAFATVDMGREELAERVALLRSALDPGAATLGDIPAFDLAAAYRLYEALLQPVAAGWRDAKSLLVVPHGALGYLPLSVLPTQPTRPGPEKAPLFSNYRDVPWLARSHAVTVLPSVASLRTLRDLPAGRPGRETLVAFADPLFGDRLPVAPGTATGDPAVAGDVGAVRGVRLNLRAGPGTESLASAQLAMLPRLPETADEVRAIALALDADPSKLFLGPDASEERVKTMDLSGVKVLAFATHGLVPGDLDGLTQPALALSSPRLSGTEGDGLLTMGEILGLKLDADWVVLSACNTGAGAGAGAEAVSGLGRAFFYAGSRALLVSNWPVHSASAKDLTTDLFRRQAENPGLGRGEALRHAMATLIDGDGLVDTQGRVVFSYAHPLFWAPFTLVGDGGVSTPFSGNS